MKAESQSAAPSASSQPPKPAPKAPTNAVKPPPPKSGSGKPQEAKKAHAKGTQKPVSFPKRLQALSHRLEIMLVVAGRTAAGLNRIYSGERMYCTRVLQQVMKDRAETKSIADFNTAEPVSNAWVAVEKLIDSELNHRANIAEEVLTKVVGPLNNWIIEAKKKHRAIAMQQQAWKRELHKNEDEVIGNRELCRELLDSCFRAQQDEAKKKDEVANQGGISFLSKLSMGVTELYRGTLPELHRKVQIAITDYSKKIELANKRMERYIRADLIRVCHEYRQLTVTTVANVKTFLGTYHQMQVDLGKKTPRVDALGKLLENMQAGGGLPALLKRAEEDHRKSLPSMLQQQRYTYELPVTLEMVQKGVYSSLPVSGKKPQLPSIFSSSLEKIIKIQRENKALGASQRKLPIPTPMEALIKLIKKLGGLKTEGIFRLSAPKEDLHALAAALDRGFITGKYKFFATTPHAPAVMLKRWLRSLSEPLIPSPLYTEAMDLVRPDGGYSGDEPSAEIAAAARALVHKLPAIHRNVLYALIKFTHEVAANEKDNRMNLSSLAVVLGPCVIRNPSPNPQSILTEARASGSLTKLLFLSLTPAPSAPTEAKAEIKDKPESGEAKSDATEDATPPQNPTVTEGDSTAKKDEAETGPEAAAPEKQESPKESKEAGDAAP